jgi:putative tricarboxylic transport membrane protein
VTWTELGLALGVLGVGAVLLAGAPAIPEGAGYDRIGPRFFPYVVGAGLVALGGSLLPAALRGRIPRHGSGAKAPLEWRPLGGLVLALLVLLAAMERAGFLVAAAAQFWLVARALRSDRPLRDAVVAAALATAVYLAWTRGLGLALPAGAVERLS